MQEPVRTASAASHAPDANGVARTVSAPAKRSTARWWIGGGVLLVLAIGGGVTWWRTGRVAPVHYTTVPVSRGPVARTVTATGTVNPVLTIIVGSYVSGVIQDLTCDYNTRVKKGQVCAKIDPRPYQVIVDQAEATLETSRAQLGKDRANLAYAKLTYDRNAAMLKNGAVTQDALDLSKSAYDQAVAQIAVDSATIDQHQAELRAAQVNLEYTSIVSPVDGTVVSRNVTMGQTVAASFQTPTLFLIATALTNMEVDANISESDIGGVKQKNPSVFSVEAYPNRAFHGVVTQVRQSPLSVQNVITYDVVVSVPNKDLALMPGMTATTKIVTAQRDSVMRVPDQALRYSPGGLAAAPAAAAIEPPSAAHVWLLRDGRPARGELTTGLDDDSFTEVVKGDLRVGDQVIVSERASAPKKGGPPTPPRAL